jgi:hypothetical protein
MQYQLMRAFGRVLGLGWSQTNDDVFTGTPVASNAEEQNWPVMHPIDVICGPYTYQCQVNPFTLRPDDVGSITQLYPVPVASVPAGKTASFAQANSVIGTLTFPDGQGMQGMNVVIRRHWPNSKVTEGALIVSGTTGMLFRSSGPNVVTGTAPTTVASSMGGTNVLNEGKYSLGWIPMVPGYASDDLYMSTEPINPLYMGQYSVGPYRTGTVTPSGNGTPNTWIQYAIPSGYQKTIPTAVVPGAVAACNAMNAGTAAAPVSADASGWWTGVLCGYGVAAWPSFTVAANRSFTVEVTAVDESGNATTNKLRPLVGVWKASDTGATLPTIAATPGAFNSVALGMTSLTVAGAPAGGLKMAIADDRGDGRPDYGYRARVLYADSLAPASVGTGGGIVTISGMGFRAGNAVTVNGVSAQVLGWTATSIVAIAPSFASLNSTATAGDVAVTDVTIGGTTVMSGALQYPAGSGPSATAAVYAATPLVYVAGGLTVPVIEQMSLSNASAWAVGVPVSWTASSGAVAFPSGASSVSGAGGVAVGTAVFGPLAGGVQAIGSACAWTSVCASFAGIGVDASVWAPAVVVGGVQSVTAASGAQLATVAVEVTDGAGHPVVGAPVQVYQAVESYQVCPARGSCPAPAIYRTSKAALVTDINGLVEIVPQQVGMAETTVIGVSTGTQGFLTVSLEKTP